MKQVLMFTSKKPISTSKSFLRAKFFTAIIGFLFCFFSVASAAEIQYHNGDRKDPFIPLVDPTGKVAVGAAAPKDALKVEGIIFDPIEGSYALINGKFYKQGDTAENAIVVSILKDRVILSVNDTEKVMWLREEVVEK